VLSGPNRGGGWVRGLGRLDAPCRSATPPPFPAGSFRNLGTVAVHGPRMGQHGFEASVGSYPSDAVLRDAPSHAELFGHLRETCFAARGVAERFRVRCRSPGVVVAYGDSSSDSCVHI